MRILVRLPGGRAGSRQQRHVVWAGAGNNSGSMRSRRTAACTIVSTAKPAPRLAGTRPLTASSMVPAKLVPMVPWVPAPLQPMMDKLHPIMTAPRRPLAWLGMNTATNAGALCGHFSFAILTAAYLETDVLTLR